MWRGVGIVGSMCTLSRICTEPSGLGDAFLKATSRAADLLSVLDPHFTWLTKYNVFWREFSRGGRKSPKGCAGRRIAGRHEGCSGLFTSDVGQDVPEGINKAPPEALTHFGLIDPAERNRAERAHATEEGPEHSPHPGYPGNKCKIGSH